MQDDKDRKGQTRKGQKDGFNEAVGKAEKWTQTKVISEVKLIELCERLDKGNRNREKLRIIIHIVCIHKTFSIYFT